MSGLAKRVDFGLIVTWQVKISKTTRMIGRKGKKDSFKSVNKVKF